jgi:hypothetical protein
MILPLVRKPAIFAPYPYKPIKGKFGEPDVWDGLSALSLVLAQRYLSGLITTEAE